MTLRYLRPGSRFRIREMPELCGVLVKVTDCRAVVRYDRQDRFVHFTRPDGSTCEFERKSGTVDITPYVDVDRA